MNWPSFLLLLLLLQEAELESIQMQTQLDQIREERRRLQNSIMEAE